MFLISLIQYLQLAHQGAVQVKALIDAVRAGRGRVTRDGTATGEDLTPEQLQESYDELIAKAGEVGDDFIGDIASRHRLDP